MTTENSTQSPNVYGAAPVQGNYTAEANEHLAQATALATSIVGEGFDSFAAWNNDIQHNLLWLLSSELKRAGQAMAAERDARRARDARLARNADDPQLKVGHFYDLTECADLAASIAGELTKFAAGQPMTDPARTAECATTLTTDLRQMDLRRLARMHRSRQP
jgi:hypothetical protein